MLEAGSVVIIGGGQAAARCAQALRAAGFAGGVTIVGDEPHLPYERPALSKAMLLDPAAAIPFVLPETHFAANAIDVRTDCVATEIDRATQTVRLADGERISYDRLVIATGSRTRTVAIDGVDPASVLTLRTLDESRALKAQLASRPALAVIGGGFIGLEVAASAASLGCAVTVIEAAERLLPRLGCAQASAIVLAHHRALGIDVRLATVARSGADSALQLSDGSSVRADVILAGVGVTPDTALAEAAGLEVEDGILVDAFGATSDPCIFAAGDVTRHYSPVLGRHVRLESWQNANAQADAVGKTIAGLPTESAELPWLWSDQGDLNLQMAGAPAAIDRTVMRGDPAGSDGVTIFQLQGSRLVGGVTLNRGRDMPLIRRLLAQPALELDVAALADPAVPLRRLLPAREAA
ncbi:FAD-dependent oxidoreductase [Sphingomonas sp. AOB5]|uniref:NAD(P)/FAD-dependent oxidoreductase n=1 Tax=Sphingomonas sp. AOB5 TaxID=3034017 RepID=UPI0023F90DE3|nr:FAD-dependent oxidoreductase [Sphingomonas sp. AOB5]MDF7775603.1 FAD-dependent oxidoreductase [Sphingomonas sp. AOB5]